MKSAEFFLQKGADPGLAPWFGYLYDVAVYNGLKPHVTSVFRSIAKQAQLYDRYKRGVHRYPVAPPGRSYHNYGRAVDMVVENAQGLGAFWVSLGGRYGGERDPIHFYA